MLRNTVGKGWEDVKFPGKKHYEDLCRPLLFNISSIMRGWVGVKFTGKKRYVTLEWPLSKDVLFSNTHKNNKLDTSSMTSYLPR